MLPTFKTEVYIWYPPALESNSEPIEMCARLMIFKMALSIILSKLFMDTPESKIYVI